MSLGQTLLNTYDRYMHLKIFVPVTKMESQIHKNLYLLSVEKHNQKMSASPNSIDAGFDLMIPNETDFVCNTVNMVDFGIICSATMVLSNGKEFSTGYYIHPRSSLSKSQLRLANSTGIIDAGYRGNLIGAFDALTDCRIAKYDRLLQICAPGLVPIVVTVVNELDDNTARGDGGFGSTGR
jgi:dUTP pyrophosphatase